MLYRFVKILMRAAIGLFYKDIQQHHLECIPSSGAALLIANHPSSLMDAAILGVLLKRPIHYFARGDVFISPIVTRLLNALHMYPVHHHDAGRATLRKNDKAFEIASDLLSNGQLVLFFPEGTSHTEYRLWNFKKGAFRIAMQLVQGNKDLILPIIPIGINYSHPSNIFSRVWVQAGAPIIANDYLRTYNTEPAVALKQICQKSFQAIKELVIDCGMGDAGALYQLMDTWRNSQNNSADTNGDTISREIIISTTFPILPAAVLEDLNDYRESLTNAKLQDVSIAAQGAAKSSVTPLIIGFPAALIGWVLNAFPLLLARIIADRKVLRIDFYSWILVASTAFLYLLWVGMISIAAFVVLPGWKAVAFLFIMVSTGQYCWNYFNYYHSWKISRDLKKIPPAHLSDLSEKRNKILVAINALS
jgi:1-acyl-sn-glycerol-3-phosphate acyltransferase